MTLKKLLNTLVRIDPDGKIGDFIYSLTYLEARALKDCIKIVDENFYIARTSVMGKIKKIHTKSAIYQYFEHDIEDVHLKVWIANASELGYKICIPFVGIKVSMMYDGLERPISLAIKSSDKDAKGYIDEKDWEEFFNVFMETLNRYIRVARKGAPKFQYKRLAHKSYSSNRLDVVEEETPNDIINNMINNPDIAEHVKGNRNVRYTYQPQKEHSNMQNEYRYTLKPNPDYDENEPDEGLSNYSLELVDEDIDDSYIDEEEISYTTDDNDDTVKDTMEDVTNSLKDAVKEAMDEEANKKEEDESNPTKEPKTKPIIILNKDKKRRN